MADEEPKTTSVEPETTTVSETTTEAPKVESTEQAEPETADAKDSEPKEQDVATAGPQATTEVNAPDGDGKIEIADLPNDVADGNATPSTNKNGKRKSTGGVPEHKGKKLNKKKSMVQLNLDVKEGDHYWARLKGYPPWPSVVCDEDMLPESLLGNRPVSARRVDGSYREDFLDGGKNARDRTYPVMFLGTGEFAWIVNTGLTKLEPGDCSEDKQTGKMSKALKEAYTIAEERHDLPYFKNMLQEFMEAQKAAQEEEAAKQAEKEAKAAAKQEKADKAAAEKTTKEKKERRKSSKSKATVSEDDEMDIDAIDEEAKPSKKRKKDADSEGEAPKPKKTPKAVKLTAPKTNGESAKKATKPKKQVSKPTEEEPKETLTEEEKLDRRNKAILYLRHRLQKGFLMRDQIPKEDEMQTMSDFFTQLEGYSDLEPSIIRGTKIYKVLRGIIKLSFIPKEEEFQFKKRSNEMLASWHEALGSKGDDKDDDKPEEKENGEKAEKPEESAEKETEEEKIEQIEETAEKLAIKESSAVPAEAATEDDNKDVAMADAGEEKQELAQESEAADEAPDAAENDTADA